MPLTVPATGAAFAFANGAVFSLMPERNNGSVTAFTFAGVIWDSVLNRIVVASNTGDYVGTKSSALAKIQQVAVLPVAAVGSVGLCYNWNDGGVIFQDGAGAYFRSDSAFTAWTAFGAGGGAGQAVFTMSNQAAGRVYRSGGFGTRLIAQSNDNGATWATSSLPVAFGTAQFSANSATVTNKDGTVALIGGNTQLLSTKDPDNTATGYEIYSFPSSTGANSCAAISDDGERAVVSGTGGSILCIDGGLQAGNEFTLSLAENFFRQTPANGVTPSFIHYSARLGGFLVFGQTPVIVGFIPDADMTTMQRGVLLGNTTFSNPISPMGMSAEDLDGNIYFGAGTNIAGINIAS